MTVLIALNAVIFASGFFVGREIESRKRRKLMRALRKEWTL